MFLFKGRLGTSIWPDSFLVVSAAPVLAVSLRVDKEDIPEGLVEVARARGRGIIMTVFQTLDRNSEYITARI